MFRLQAKTLRAAAFTISALLATTVAVPLHAQISVNISFDNFHNRLAPYGTWSTNARWGEVWRPRAQNGFRPYYNGHWEDTTEYGWLWISSDAWGDVPYHYGRWVSDPREGWLWVPGYVWGPSWVVWRSGGGNIGWFPMPPGDNYDGTGAYRDNFENQYGYRDWYGPSFSNDQFESMWIFVGEDHFRDRDFRSYAVPQRNYGGFFSQSRNTTNYTTVNNYVVNHSVGESQFKGYQNQRFQPVSASSVLSRDSQVTPVDAGRQVEQRERLRHPIPASINPAEQRGQGIFNSPSQQLKAAQTPDGPAGRGDKGPNANDTRQALPQTGRGVVATPANPAGGAPGKDSRGQANLNPAEQRGRANQNSNGPAPANSNAVRDVPAASTPAPKDKPAPQDRAERGKPGPAAAEKPGANNRGPVNTQAGRGPTPQIPVAAQAGREVIVQDARKQPPRVQNAPAAASQGNAKNDQARGNGPNDASDKKQNGADRGQN